MTEPILGGRLDGGVHRLPVRIYWEDTDAGGIVYHASYIRFMERGRTEFLRALGLEQQGLRESLGLVFIVRKLTAEYLAPGVLDDLLSVETAVARLGGASLALEQTVRRGEAALAQAEVICVCVGPDGKPKRIPDDLRQRFSDGVG